MHHFYRCDEWSGWNASIPRQARRHHGVLSIPRRLVHAGQAGVAQQRVDAVGCQRGAELHQRQEQADVRQGGGTAATGEPERAR